MKNLFIITLMLVAFMACTNSVKQQEETKVFIGADMEGIAGVVSSRDECSSSGADYEMFREIMTEEVNAAIIGAIKAGATEVVVRDGHGSGRNILPTLLHPEAKLVRSWSGGTKSMMEGIDESFDAVVFIGYHAKAGTPNGIIAHTMSGNVIDVSINGISLPEAGINALIAGHFNVPVVFLAGDKAICDQAKEIFGDISTYAVKEGIGKAEVGVHPKVARKNISNAVFEACSNIETYKPFILKAPFKLHLKVKRERELYPGAEKISEGEFIYSSDKIMDVIEAFNKMI